MCGIVGVAGQLFRAEKIALRDMLVFSWRRGPHSTGVGTIIEKTNNMHTYKVVGDPFGLFRMKAYSNGDGVYEGAPKVMIGHNRYATVGKVIAANAHPYRHGPILGCHNGTLSKWHLDQLEDYKDFDVDSEAIFHTIEKVGWEETMKRLHGAWALCWYNQDEQKMYFTRNTERDLYYAWSKDHKVLFWASEAWEIIIAASKNNLPIEEPQMFEAYHMYTLDMSDANKLNTKGLVKSEKLYKGFTFPSFQPVKTTIKDWMGGKTGSTNSAHTGTTTDTVPFDGYHGGYMTHNVAEKKRLHDLVSKEVRFYIGNPQMSEEGLKYLLCHFADPKLSAIAPIRLFCDKHKRQKEWMNATGDFMGKVRKLQFSPKGHPYYLLDMRTISNEIHTPFSKAMARADKEDGILAKGFMDKPLTKDRFLHLVSNGCSYCSSDLSWDDRDSIIWCDETTPIGPCCATDPSRIEDIQLMYGMAGKVK